MAVTIADKTWVSAWLLSWWITGNSVFTSFFHLSITRSVACGGKGTCRGNALKWGPSSSMSVVKGSATPARQMFIAQSEANRATAT
eukprot:CAMPEP_0184678730 /NCGR_PEP_ID=MMETSP0312-20130426/1527_1 /TAXON_ID=31354 /ORGANISM="Compsopogon coeruleus, Strain SAG 36.94" /LENGTH=85 /DNA_ID=CAMNT_0027127701 /DNA_START=576 /DNA_END=833 /DNA_ORIENTATION=-